MRLPFCQQCEAPTRHYTRQLFRSGRRVRCARNSTRFSGWAGIALFFMADDNFIGDRKNARLLLPRWPYGEPKWYVNVRATYGLVGTPTMRSKGSASLGKASVSRVCPV